MTSARPRTLAFFVFAIGFTWLAQLPAVLGRFGILPGGAERYLVPAALGGFGPVLAAVAASWLEARGAGVRALFRPIRTWRVGPHWYVIALGGFAAAFVVGTAIVRLAGGPAVGRWFYPPENAEHITALILIPLVEEPGWRGFALPRLQERYGRRRASLVLGALWTAWHGTMWILQGLTPMVFLIAAVVVIAGSVIFSVIYNHTRGSLLLAIVAHAGAHASNPFHAYPATLIPLAIYGATLAVIAALLLIFDRSFVSK